MAKGPTNFCPFSDAEIKKDGEEPSKIQGRIFMREFFDQVRPFRKVRELGNPIGNRFHALALKMGIATATVNAWKSGLARPQSRQMRETVAILGTYRHSLIAQCFLAATGIDTK